MERSDTVVVGAGMAGLTCARMLADAGRQVVVVEARDRVEVRRSAQLAEGSSLMARISA